MTLKPDVRQARPRPGRRQVFAEVVIRAARLLGDERRARVPVAELGADHLVALGLLDLGHFDQLVQVAPQAAPLAPPEGGVARRRDVALAHRAALGLVGVEELRPAPAAQRRRRASRPGRWRRRRRCSCPGRRSESRGAPRRRRGTRGARGSARRAAGSASTRRRRASRTSPARRSCFSNCARHVLVALDHRVQRPVARRVLHDEEGRLRRRRRGSGARAPGRARWECGRTARRSGTAPGAARRMSPSPGSAMPSCWRTRLPPPSHPRGNANESVLFPLELAVTPCSSCSNDRNSQP